MPQGLAGGVTADAVARRQRMLARELGAGEFVVTDSADQIGMQLRPQRHRTGAVERGTAIWFNHQRPSCRSVSESEFEPPAAGPLEATVQQMYVHPYGRV